MKKITLKSIAKIVCVALLFLSGLNISAQRQMLAEWNFTNNSLKSDTFNLDFQLPPNTASNNADETGGEKDNTFTINGSKGGGTTPFLTTAINSGKFTISMSFASWSFGTSQGNDYWGVYILDSEDQQIGYFRFITQDKLSSNPPYIGSSLYASFINPEDASFNNGGTLKAGVLSRGQSSTDYTAGNLPITVNLTIDFDNDNYVVWLGDTTPEDDLGNEAGSSWDGRFAGYTGTIKFDRTIAALKWQWGGNGGGNQFVELDRVAVYLGQNATASVEDFDKFNFSYYPNPSKNTINVSANDAIESIEVYNLVGQLVVDKKMNTINSNIDISDLNRGVYIMKVKINGTQGSYKLIKE